MGRTISSFRKIRLAVGLITLVAVPASAQVGSLLGSLDGSYCKAKSRDRIEVDSRLPLDASEAYLTDMTLRRLASLSRSKGFEGFIIDSETRCGVLMQGTKMLSRHCLVKAVAANRPAEANPLEAGKTWVANADVFARTDADAASYPVRTGLLARGSACVID